MFSGVSAENIKKNKLCALCAFAVNMYFYDQGTMPEYFLPH
jgi:hypothetical protein